MKISFITTNKHKFEEVREVLKEFNIETIWENMTYPEDHDMTIEEIAKTSAYNLANELNKTVVLEDTGIFFNAYPGFPGALPKFVANTIGLKGILKLLKGEDRSVYFKTIVGLGMPGKDSMTFEGVMSGQATDEIINEEIKNMPYDNIFTPEGFDKTISQMTMEEKNSIYQRGKAFRKLGEYLTNNPTL